MTAQIARRAAELEVSRGGVPDRRYTLTDSVVRIGRAHDNELVLEDSTKSVSRYHAEIRPEAEGYVLLDLASQNGTWVGTERVERVVLEPGREVTLGPYRLALVDATVDLSERQTVIAGAWSSGASAEVPEPVPTPTTDPHRAHPPRTPSEAPPAPTRKGRAKVLWVAGGGAIVLAALVVVVVFASSGAVSLPAARDCRCGPGALGEQFAARAARLASSNDVAAARSALAMAREWRPADAGIAVLLADVDERLFSPALAPPPPPETAAPPPAKADQGSASTDASTGLKQGRTEKRAAFQKRVREATDAYAAVEAALAREDLRAAGDALAALEHLAPSHPKLIDARQAIEQLTARRDGRAAALVREGRELETSGNLPAARRKLQEANGVKPGVADPDLQRLNGRMGQLGTEQCAKGKASEAFGNNEQAKTFYRRALELFPPDHPDRAECESRLRALP